MKIDGLFEGSMKKVNQFAGEIADRPQSPNSNHSPRSMRREPEGDTSKNAGALSHRELARRTPGTLDRAVAPAVAGGSIRSLALDQQLTVRSHRKSGSGEAAGGGAWPASSLP
jgi:hypothetical protein